MLQLECGNNRGNPASIAGGNPEKSWVKIPCAKKEIMYLMGEHIGSGL
jgi:hypothetical protein